MAVDVVSAAEFGNLFLRGVPFIDVRAEVEYAKGSFPTAVNMPILTTGERAAVGTTYKGSGPDAAVALGHRLVSGAVKEARVGQWREFAHRHPDAHVYCWRGGMRSNLAVQWLREAGVRVPVIEGGYKALRRFLMAQTERAAAGRLLRIGGRTGCDKTGLLHQLPGAVDLEHHANHRGSSFGRRATPVPTQVDFEHRLAIDLLRHQHGENDTLILEDESRCIGTASIPLALYRAMSESPLAVVERPLAERVEVVRRTYIVDLYAEFRAQNLDDPFGAFSDHLLAALQRLTRRLGLESYRRLERLLRQALEAQWHGDDGVHRQWIRALLADYYDPLYDYQLRQVRDRIAFRGSWQEVLEWARDYAGPDGTTARTLSRDGASASIS